MKTALECMKAISKATMRWSYVEMTLGGMAIGFSLVGIITSKFVWMMGVLLAMYLCEKATVRRERLNGLFWKYSARQHQRWVQWLEMAIEAEDS